MGRFRNWLDVRVGLEELGRKTFTDYRVPKHINLFHTLGSVAFIGYIIQVVSGIFLVFYYIPHAEHAFGSVQNIMNKVPFGWLVRQIHVVGSNMMITAVALHLLTIFIMGNYKRPREMTWIVGGMMFILTLIFGLSGYLLPWSQLSYWATTVVTAIPTAFPVVGDFLTRLLRGGDLVSGVTLTRFFAVHVVVLPPIFLILMAAHFLLIRRIGFSATPFGRSDEEKRPLTEFRRKTHPDGYSYYPYLFMRQLFMVLAYCAVMFLIISLAPNFFLPEEANMPANPLQTPEQIRPEWYMLAPYQLLKLIPNKFLGISVILLIGLAFLLLPFYDVEKEKNIMKRPILNWSFIGLMILWVVLTFWGIR